eukprot:TRINITY_DN20597_c0_g1_i1.p1 TRINITY_DN20597_c0_g1~~TRINITY_DN20597_c0_g1_i1.p1  ORF type:complete len:173 (-),score=48.75 TRINITY_DN20597_c0_g1_i1:54-572(-)
MAIFFFKQKTAYEMLRSLVGSEMCIRDSFCTALSCQRRSIPSFHYMVAAAGGTEISCAEYGTFGSQELSDGILRALGGERRACLMANHGMVCFGSNLQKAVRLAEEVEVLAKQYVYTCQLGPPVLLDETEMRIILAKFKTYGVDPDKVGTMDAFTRLHAIVPPTRQQGAPPC